MMKKLIFILSVFLFSGCSDANLPDLPDIDNNEHKVDTILFDDEESDDSSVETGDENDYDETEDDLSDEVLTDLDEVPDESEPVIISSLIVATVGGYDVPFSGKALFSNDESFEGLEYVHEDEQMGSSDGADITIGGWDDGFFIVGRHDSSNIYFFDENSTKDGFDFSSIDLGNGNYINLQEGIYNPFKEEFIFSAMSSNKLIILKNDVISELKISDSEFASPSKMRMINDKLYVSMLNLNDQWVSEKGEIAVIDLSSYEVNTVLLPSQNPTGGIEYNGNVDKDHLYIACSGTWQKRDGSLARVNLNTLNAAKVLSESDKGDILDGDFVDVSIADNGMFYIIFSHNNDGWINKLLKYDPKKGTVSQIDSGINAFAAKPIDYSPVTHKLYYFADSGPDTFLRSLDTVTDKMDELKMEAGPAAVKIWVREQ
jgi:hypothetical protein